jgi:hypothetical protein
MRMHASSVVVLAAAVLWAGTVGGCGDRFSSGEGAAGTGGAGASASGTNGGSGGQAAAGGTGFVDGGPGGGGGSAGAAGQGGQGSCWTCAQWWDRCANATPRDCSSVPLEDFCSIPEAQDYSSVQLCICTECNAACLDELCEVVRGYSYRGDTCSICINGISGGACAAQVAACTGL